MASTKKSEKSIEHEILHYLNRLPGCFAWKVNTTGIFDGQVYRKAMSPFILKGVSDVIGVYAGRLIAFEVKTDTGQPSKEQLAFIAKVQKCGGVGGVVRSIQDVRRVLIEAGLLSQELTDVSSIEQ
jgi:penicillin-binding protein-related factor A (putative recombinase)